MLLIHCLRRCATWPWWATVRHSQQLDHAVVGDLLTMAEVPASAQEQIVSLYLEHDGDDASFWKTLGKDPRLLRLTPIKPKPPCK